MIQHCMLQGLWTLEHYRLGKLLSITYFFNGITDVGMNTLLDIGFYSASKISTWYAGLISNAGFSALNDADTMGSHAGWAEFTGYSESVRQTWTTTAPASRAVSNSSPITFSINATGTVKGIFITSSNVKSGTTGTLWSTALMAADIAVVNGDSLKFTYTISG